MNIKQLISNIKNKLEKKIIIQSLIIEDKSFLHKKHKSNQMGKYHLKLSIKSNELNNLNKIEANKLIYSILDDELKNNIHSIQILFN